ncbi:MAG: GlsB/YeaQ/YmgE family stress response membrane protein [Rhodothermales bacterium]|nr:GlsB/YeaQ/YmgE family stress response membrane protein [Rhodothermales bacterium]
MLDLLLVIIVGGLIGWVASKVMGTDPEQGVLLNVVVGIVGALLAGFLLNPLIGGGNILAEDFSLSALLVSFLGAVLLLFVWKLITGRRVA